MDLPQFATGFINQQINRWFLWGSLLLLPVISVLSYLYCREFLFFHILGIVITTAATIYGLVLDNRNRFRHNLKKQDFLVSQGLLIFYGLISIPISAFAGLPVAILMGLLMTVSIVLFTGKLRYVVSGFYFIAILAALIIHGVHGVHGVRDDMQWYQIVPHSLETILYALIAVVALLNTTIVAYVLRKWKNVARGIEADYRDIAELKHKQDEIYAIIGHELRTPASIVQMLLDDILEQRETKDPRYQLREAYDNIEHLLSVLDDMKISITKEVPRQISAPQNKINVFEIIQRSKNGLTQLAEQYKCNIELKGDNCSNSTVFGSGKAIQQVVQNLVKNAIIHSECDSITIDIHTRNDGMQTSFDIFIIDDGKGIDHEFRTRMWEPFTRGQTKSSGSGLGLNICRDIAVNMPNGNLSYEPGLYGGSVFVFSFSLINAAEDSEAEPEPINHVDGKHILFVEDTATLRMLGGTILKRNGATVVEAENGIEALHHYEVGEFDMIFTDISMPEMNGYEFTKEVRKLGFKGPILGITGATVGQEADKLIECGADAVVSKPMRIEAINTRLGSILDDQG